LREVIIATNPSMEGEVTATTCSTAQADGVRVTRIARLGAVAGFAVTSPSMDGFVAMITSRNPAPLRSPRAPSTGRGAADSGPPRPRAGRAVRQHVVASPEPPGALDGPPRPRLPPPRHSRLASRRGSRQIAHGSSSVSVPHSPQAGHPRADGADRLRQARGGLRRLLQQVKREPLRCLPSDPGELSPAPSRDLRFADTADYSGS